MTSLTDTIFTAASVAVGVVTAAAGNADLVTPGAMLAVGGGIVFAFAGIMSRQILDDVRTTRDALLAANLPERGVRLVAVETQVQAIQTDVHDVRQEWHAVQGEWRVLREEVADATRRFSTEWRGAFDEVVAVSKEVRAEQRKKKAVK